MNTRTAIVAAAAVVVVASAASLLVTILSGRSDTLILVAALQTVAILTLLCFAALWFVRSRAASSARATRIANLERRLEEFRQLAESAERASVARREAVEEMRVRITALEVPSTSAVPMRDVDGQEHLTASFIALGTHQGLSLSDYLGESQAVQAVRRAIAQERPLDTLPYLDSFPNLAEELTLSDSRKLLKGLRRLGYLEHAAKLVTVIATRFGNPADVRAADLYRSELALYRGDSDLEVELPLIEGEHQSNVVLHVVGKALPETQSGYTLRTQYTVEAQRRLGIEPIVVAQSGASARPHQNTETYEHRGVRYYLLGGPQRGSVPWDEWLRANVLALAEVVRLAKPAAIHTHSDFMNAMIALPVAQQYGIPLVNETRGFWEESWLSRTATAEGWEDLQALEQGVGLPEMYRLRVEREAETRSASDAVVTLARVMRDHIEVVGDRLGLAVPEVSIAPNSVQAEDFPVRMADAELRDALGLESDAVVIGYISSIVEYEGIDTLVRGVYELACAVEASRALRVGSEAARLAPSRAANWAEGSVEEQPRRSQALPALHAALEAGEVRYGNFAEQGPTCAPSTTDAVRDEPAYEALLIKLARVAEGDDDSTLRDRADGLLDAVGSYDHLPVRLLVVGDGPELSGLRELASQLGLDGALFPGRVPHETVLDYYGLIDLFVVPRKRAAVTELVTPLKPFEAMATGRPCMFSDVKALAEIAADSGCVELFRADDHHDLAVRAGRLLADPERLATMSSNGAEWVRDARTWDHNALVYLELYRTLGVVVPAEEADTPADGSEPLRSRGDEARR